MSDGHPWGRGVPAGKDVRIGETNVKGYTCDLEEPAALSLGWVSSYTTERGTQSVRRTEHPGVAGAT